MRDVRDVHDCMHARVCVDYQFRPYVLCPFHTFLCAEMQQSTFFFLTLEILSYLFPPLFLFILKKHQNIDVRNHPYMTARFEDHRGKQSSKRSANSHRVVAAVQRHHCRRYKKPTRAPAPPVQRALAAAVGAARLVVVALLLLLLQLVVPLLQLGKGMQINVPSKSTWRLAKQAG